MYFSCDAVRVIGDRENVRQRRRATRASVRLQLERHGLAPDHCLRELSLVQRHLFVAPACPSDPYLRAVDGAHTFASVLALLVRAVVGEPLGVEAGVRYGAGDDAGGLVDELQRKLAQVSHAHVLRSRLELVNHDATVRLRGRLLDSHAEVLRFTTPVSILDANFENRLTELVGRALIEFRVGWIKLHLAGVIFS